MTVFSERLVPERVQLFWAAMQRGEFLTGAAAQAGTYRARAAGGWSRRVGCAPGAAVISLVAACRLRSGKRSRWDGLRGDCAGDCRSAGS